MNIVILLGAPGSGKGTIAGRLASEDANLKHVSSGDLLRGAVAKGAADEGIQSQLAAKQVCRYLLEKYDHPEHLSRMAEKMKALATPDAAAKVADLVEGKMV